MARKTFQLDVCYRILEWLEVGQFFSALACACLASLLCLSSVRSVNVIFRTRWRSTRSMFNVQRSNVQVQYSTFNPDLFMYIWMTGTRVAHDTKLFEFLYSSMSTTIYTSFSGALHVFSVFPAHSCSAACRKSARADFSDGTQRMKHNDIGSMQTTTSAMHLSPFSRRAFPVGIQAPQRRRR